MRIVRQAGLWFLFLLLLPFTAPGLIFGAIQWTWRRVTGARRSGSDLDRPMSHDSAGF